MEDYNNKKFTQISPRGFQFEALRGSWSTSPPSAHNVSLFEVIDTRFPALGDKSNHQQSQKLLSVLWDVLNLWLKHDSSRVHTVSFVGKAAVVKVSVDIIN